MMLSERITLDFGGRITYRNFTRLVPRAQPFRNFTRLVPRAQPLTPSRPEGFSVSTLPHGQEHQREASPQVVHEQPQEGPRTPQRLQAGILRCRDCSRPRRQEQGAVGRSSRCLTADNRELGGQAPGIYGRSHARARPSARLVGRAGPSRHLVERVQCARLHQADAGALPRRLRRQGRPYRQGKDRREPRRGS